MNWTYRKRNVFFMIASFVKWLLNMIIFIWLNKWFWNSLPCKRKISYCKILENFSNIKFIPQLLIFLNCYIVNQTHIKKNGLYVGLWPIYYKHDWGFCVFKEQLQGNKLNFNQHVLLQTIQTFTGIVHLKKKSAIIEMKE